MANNLRRYHLLEPINDWAHLIERYRVLEHGVRLPGDGKLHLVAREQWVAVPTEDGVPSGGDVRRIAKVCDEQGWRHLWALAMEELQVRDSEGREVHWPYGFDVPATTEGVEQFVRAIVPLHYALLPPDGSWMILAMLRDDLEILVGPPEIVQDVLGCSVERVYEEYEDEIDGARQRGNISLAESRRAELEKLRDTYGSLPPGDELALDGRSWATWSPRRQEPL